MLTKNDFDDKAKTWDDPIKTQRALSVAAAIRRTILLRPDMKGFEYGCGTGLLSFALRTDLAQITMADSSQGMLAVAQEKIVRSGSTTMRTALLNLAIDPPPGEAYDIVYSLLAFHHILSLDTVLARIHTMLNTQGYLCIADLDKEDGSFHGEGFTGHQGFDREILAKNVAEGGFRDIAVTSILDIEKETLAELRAGIRSFF